MMNPLSAQCLIFFGNKNNVFSENQTVRVEAAKLLTLFKELFSRMPTWKKFACVLTLTPKNFGKKVRQIFLFLKIYRNALF